MNEPIDAVISWVDGYDPLHQQKLADFCLKNGIIQKEAIEPTRINQCGEIAYCLHSLFRFAPWLRTIYIVTDNQTPNALEQWKNTVFEQRIQIINQADLFEGHERCLPVFNSLTIEWVLHRIPGLSNQFLYLNDDFFLTRPVQANDFFCDEHIVLRGDWKTQTQNSWFFWSNKNKLKRLAKNNPHRHWQETSAMCAGLKKRFYFLHHAPYVLMKNTFTQFIEENPQFFSDNIQFSFRHTDQISPIPLMTHLKITRQEAVFSKQPKAIMVNGATHSFAKIKSRLNKIERDQHIAFLCMQSIDQAPLEIQQYMLDWLEKNIGSTGIPEVLRPTACPQDPYH